MKNEYSSDLFSFKYYNIKDNSVLENHDNSCSIITITNGNGILKVNTKEYVIKKYDTIIVPAIINKYELIGKLEVIISWI